MAGQAVFAFGTQIKSLPLMLLGRFIYGLGGENMAVGASVILEEWFRNKEMALAMALNVAVSRIGSVVNNILSPAIAESGGGVPLAFWVGALICGGSLACTMVIMPIDRAVRATHPRHPIEASIDLLALPHCLSAGAFVCSCSTIALACSSSTNERSNY